MSDCHLGSWRYPELQELNMKSFSKAIAFAIKEEVDMVLIAGDIFDSAYPPIEILKTSFREFKRLYDAEIPCFIIAGSHDYSVSGKTFLDVLEHAGFCKNVYNAEERDEKIVLQPSILGKYAIYGYPGMKSGLEVKGLRKTILQDSPGFFKIFMLHTALKEAIGDLPMDSISLNELPKADYYALGHLHIEFGRDNAAYSVEIKYEENENEEKLKIKVKFDNNTSNNYSTNNKSIIKDKNKLNEKEYSFTITKQKENKTKGNYSISLIYENNYEKERLSIDYKSTIGTYISRRQEALQDFSDRVPGKSLETFPVSGNEGLYGYTFLGDIKVWRRDDLSGNFAKMVDIHECIHTPDEYETRILTDWIMSKQPVKYIK